MTKQQKLSFTKKVVNENLKVRKAHKARVSESSPAKLNKEQDARIISTIHKKKGFKKRQVVEMFEKWQFAPITFPFEQSREMNDMPLVISCKIANTGIIIMKIHVDTGSSIDLIYEQCFRQLPECIKVELKPTAILTRQARLDFYVICAALRYNMLLGRSALRRLGIVPSTIPRMVKFTTCRGVATIYSMAMPSICAAISTKDAIVLHKIEDDNMVVINPKYVDQKIKIGTKLNAKIRKKIVQLLVAYMDVFAWSEQDMTGVPCNVAEHRLNANPALKPIVQKHRGMALDRMKWLSAEVAKLVNAGILREDNYPLPEIDLKVESLHDYPYKCFLDAAKGYHQIPMALEDEDKTAFHTGKGIYCYIKMPFGLKNAGATYQRLIDKAFEGQICRNLEAYVDDLVIKSKMQESILVDMQETFESLRKINMKLNPSKFSFGEREGKFLGYYVTEQGIQANPKKIAAIENMTAPKTVKEVQSLTGKIAALTRFLSKAAE
ncbi:uncharacterized protein [Rutidosis leptorrhynchoides]|uniref:uncharacterized protein n=1 Tax=Rutidosis leptorrhynchoides TaxID=125765 RepID=UPI003A995D97